LISKFLEVEDLRERAQHYAIGGYISKSSIDLNSSKNAIRFYPSWDTHGLFFHNVHVAYTQFDMGDNEPGQCRLNADEELKISSNRFTYDRDEYTKEEVGMFLSGMEEEVDNGDADTKTGDEVNNNSIEFLDRFQENGSPSNMYQCGSFDKNEMSSLLNQTGVVGMRFFFGLNVNYSNHIRLMFIGVDSAGKNILKINGSEAIMLERAWPPD
jgi:hypothetical protein